MSNTLQELRAHIKASGFESPSAKFAPLIAYIETNLVTNPNSLFKRHVPPLDIVLFAIRNLLTLPDAPRLRDIPDLLDFATTIEFYRTLALKKVQEALTIHRYYQANPDDGHLPLTDEEVRCLRAHKANDTNLRDIYIEMVLQYCQIDIYHLWTSDPPRTADVTLRLSEYFPALNDYYKSEGKAASRLFHYDLSDEERKKLHERGVDSCMFVSQSCTWARERQIPGQSLANVFQTPEFAVAFPCEISMKMLSGTMKYYLDEVERMVNELHEMFPPE
ncbi:hypothetical protein DFH06DRAFT_581974 [Mycena polygramma]|nr:hypothetical protein DFH06DRAFT_581974 [Mycena polygramma]